MGAWIRVRGAIHPDAGPLFCVSHDKCQSARPFGVVTESHCGKPLHVLDIAGDYSHPDVSAAAIGAITTPLDLADLGAYPDGWTEECPGGPIGTPNWYGPLLQFGRRLSRIYVVYVPL